MTKEQAVRIGKTINEQLGGHRFQVMTGAHSYTIDVDGSLTFKYPAKKGFMMSAVKITLNARDLYDVEFIDMTRKYEIARETVFDVYCDQLQTVFTEKTGLDTRL